MNRIDALFRHTRAQGRAALMPYLTLGYPALNAALELVPALLDAGADLIELGIPFSDPLADGATIQTASQQALEAGMTPALALEQVARLRATGVDAPLVLMTYMNPVVQMGVEAFAREAAQAGADGVIVPDAPPEEARPLEEALAAHGLALIYLAAPTTPVARLAWLAQRTRGFLYLVSLTGVTGARRALPPDLEALVARARGVTDKPLAVGFGIATPEQAARVARVADGVIVGSALLRAIAAAAGEPATAARRFVARLRDALGP